MKILVTGAAGQLGRDVCRELGRRGIEFAGPSSQELDVADSAAVNAYFAAYRPDAVIHCAGYTKVDQAEKEPERVFRINGDGTENVAGACLACGAKMLYISTDYVFSGEGDRPYETDDHARPLNVYGRSKLAGENAVKRILRRFFIVRTSWMYGGDGVNFVKTMLRLGAEQRKISVVSDQFGSPTYTVDLAVLLCDMVQTEHYGVYHATNEGTCSRADFAAAIFREMAMNVSLQPVSSEEYVTPAQRPRNSRMSKASLDAAGFCRLPAWEDALRRFLRAERVRTGRKKVLVTGGNGYIGRYVVAELLRLGHTVMVSSQDYGGMDPRAVPCPVSIFSGDPEIYDKTGRPDVCIHMAWQDGFVHNSPAHMANLSDHIVFCRSMMDGGLPVLSCMGTMHEVGYWEGAVDENTPCNPQTQYGIAKNAMRQSLLLSAAKSECVFHWLRLYYIVGDSAVGSNIFAKLLQAAAQGKKTFPFTSGRNRYDFMEIHELARLIVLASLQTEVAGVTNICTGEPESLADCVQGFIREHGLGISLAFGQYPDRPYDSPGIWGDASKIRKIVENSRKSPEKGTMGGC